MGAITVYRSAREPIAAFVLAHGAGAGQRHPFIVNRATALAALGIDVATFDFPYMEARRKVPDRNEVLRARYLEAIDAARRELPSARLLVCGGKSMGGRIATEVAAAAPALAILGIVLLGYPLHPPGRPDRRRDAHLPSVARPMLFIQGSRDAFGTPGELEPVLARISPTPALHVVEGGDHSFKLSRKDPAAQVAAHEEIDRTIAAWITRSARASR
jgi:predicted alpha/beta-hydrolase family hydrolase